MELELPSVPILLTLSFLVLFWVLVKALNTYKSKSLASNLPPGPRKWPVIGNMHQLAVTSLVHHTLRDLANKYGPLMHLQVGQVSTVVVSSSEIAKEVMKTHDAVFSYRPYLVTADILVYNSTDIVFSPYGEYWKQLRKICSVEILSPQRVQKFRRIREEEVLNLIRYSSSLSSRAPINLSSRIFTLIYGVTSRAAFGKKSKHQDKYIKLVEESLALASGFSIPDMYPSVKCLHVITGARNKVEKLHRRIDEILQVIVDEHKDQEGRQQISEDLVDVLLRIQKHGDLQIPLTDDSIKAVIHDIFTAGSESSSTTVEWAMSELLKNPEVMKRAQDEVRTVFGTKGNVDESGLHELNYLKLVIKETLRLHPATPLLVPRECSKDCEIDGY